MDMNLSFSMNEFLKGFSSVKEETDAKIGAVYHFKGSVRLVVMAKLLL